nr:murein L,D-transpeptidase family protein [Azorhizobium doebereinerae]
MAAAMSLALAACNGQGSDVSARARQPLSPQMLSLMSEKDMAPPSPILVRVFKEESELEVWKTKSDGTYALLKTYPICRWSGELGPKVKIGDRQAPEGFYTITPGLMNPNSSYYLSINTGFPNAFDKSYGRTGEFLMIHGDCSSAGCYAMTDEQIAEIFALARESFAGGQRSFQIQAMPFRMTPQNMARHRNNPNMAFWRNLKQGYDHFEVTRQEPKVDVCGRQYVFDAQAPLGQSFNPAAACPSYTVPPAIASAVSAKQRADDAKMAELAPNTPVAPVRTGRDGGMNPIFLAKLNGEENSTARLAYGSSSVPAFDPANVRPPKSDAEIAASTPAAANRPTALAARPGAPEVAATAPGTLPATTANDAVRRQTQTASADSGAAQASVLMGATPIVSPGGFGQ